MIDHYNAGRMTVQGKDYGKDIKILRHRVQANWWRKEGHRVDVEDLKDILSLRPHILVIGTGYAGNMRVEESLQSALHQHNIKLIIDKTQEAVKAFNKLLSKGEDVAGAFHLTC